MFAGLPADGRANVVPPIVGPDLGPKYDRITFTPNFHLFNAEGKCFWKTNRPGVAGPEKSWLFQTSNDLCIEHQASD